MQLQTDRRRYSMSANKTTLHPSLSLSMLTIIMIIGQSTVFNTEPWHRYTHLLHSYTGILAMYKILFSCHDYEVFTQNPFDVY